MHRHRGRWRRHRHPRLYIRRHNRHRNRLRLFTCLNMEIAKHWQKKKPSTLIPSKIRVFDPSVGAREGNKGAFLVTDNRVLNLPLGRSLRSFARTAHSAHSLRSAPLRYACSRACSLTLLTPSWECEIHEFMFTLKTRLAGMIAFVVDSRNTPRMRQR